MPRRARAGLSAAGAGRRRLRFETLESRQLLAVVINEIHYNPADNTKLEEFIELVNTGPTAVDLSGWAFTDGVQYTFAPGQQIAANGYVVIAQDPATVLSQFGAAAIGPYVGGLNSDGEHLELRNAQGVVIDEVDYNVSFPWPVQPDGGGTSMELINPALDNNLGSSWRPSYTTPLFGGNDEPPIGGGGGTLSGLVHRWSFSGNLVDTVGGANGTLVDPGGIAAFSSTQLNLSANSGQNSNQSPFTSGAYVNLPNGIISTLGGDATFEWWGTVSRNRTWAEIFSFGKSDGGEDQATSANFQEYVTLIPQADSGVLRFTHRDGGAVAESALNWNAAPAQNTAYHIAITWDSLNDQQKMYVNGTLVATGPTIIDLADIEDVNNWLGRSQWGDPLFDGFYDEFRIYNRVLTAGEIAANQTDGPDVTITGPVINSFIATPATITVGQAATLSWAVTGATSVSLNPGIGNVTGTTQIVVTPATSTTYTLAATSSEGTVTRSIVVTVNHRRATPGMQNQVYAANAAPAIRQVAEPGEQASGVPTTITAKVTDPQGVASVQLQYQIVLPGQYLPARLPAAHSDLVLGLDANPIPNPAYFNAANWTTIAMVDTGVSGDAAAGDSIFTGVIPAQSHRTLVRYRIVITDALGAAATAPYADDASLNFAYFVYDGVPEYRNNANQVLANAAAMDSLPVYHLITRSEDLDDANAYDAGDEIPQGTEGRFVYNWSGTMVYNGKVYDNITYRLRGANGRYLTDGKRSMRFRFNDGSWFEPLDQDGQPYPEKWKTLTTGKGFDNRQTLTYALNEAMTLQLSNMMGLPAPETHWFQFRVIDGASEAPDQWHGDFWGLNFALEDYDKRFLDAHGLQPGNLYKLINQTQNALRQQDYQAPFAVSDGSDHDYILHVLGQASTDVEYRVNLQKYFVYHAISEAVRNYDTWPSADKNAAWYFEPEYTAQNNNLGKLWLMFWDTDATWGPTWNEGKDVVYNALFDNVNATYKNGLLKPEYYNTLRELRDLIWQPDQIRGMLDELVSKMLPLEAADRARWQGAPADAGNYNGLSGAGTLSLTNLVQDMMNFAFTGGTWPGGDVGAGGRAAFLDGLLTASGEEALIPTKPTITYVGLPGMPADHLTFQTSAFADPQGAGTFGAVEWRLAAVTPVAAGLDPNTKFRDEWTASWDSGALTTFASTISPPATAATPGSTYRARVRFQDSTGRWSHWSDSVEFVAGAATVPSLTISELHYNPAADPLVVDAQDLEFIEVMNTGTQAIDLQGVQLATFASTPYVFGAGLMLSAGQRIVVPKNPAAFQTFYGAGVFIAPGGYGTANLSNGGETIELLAANGTVIQTIVYDDVAPWPTTPDGQGPSLEIINPTGDAASAANWRGSAMLGGSPGWDGVAGLAGDYNRSGGVNGSDFLAWQRAFGSRTPALTGADGSGNLVVDAADLTIWRNQFGASAATTLAVAAAPPVAAALDLNGWILTDEAFSAVVAESPVAAETIAPVAETGVSQSWHERRSHADRVFAEMPARSSRRTAKTAGEVEAGGTACDDDLAAAFASTNGAVERVEARRRWGR